MIKPKDSTGKQDRFFEKLTLANDFVFKMVLENPAICKKLIDFALRSLEFRFAKHRGWCWVARLCESSRLKQRNP